MLLSHEHIFCRYRGSTETVISAVRESLLEAREAGVDGIVDVTPYGPVSAYASLLTDRALPRIFGCVGFYRKRYVDRRHHALSATELRDVMGRQLLRRSKSGLQVACIKVASDSDTLSPLEDRIMTAAGGFSNERRLPIVTHAIRGCHAQVKALRAGGADPAMIMLSHVEMDLKGASPRTTPQGLAASLSPLLDRGVMLSITDMPASRSRYQTAVLHFIGELCAQGYSTSISVSSDARFALRGSHVRFSRSRDYTTVPNRLVPALARHFDTKTVAALTGSNAERFFGLGPPGASEVRTRAAVAG